MRIPGERLTDGRELGISADDRSGHIRECARPLGAPSLRSLRTWSIHVEVTDADGGPTSVASSLGFRFDSGGPV